MGWTFKKDASKADIIKDILTGAGSEYRPIVHRVVGRCLWVVWEHNSVDRNARFIGLDLLDKEKGYGWGHKSMEESQGLYEFSCPLQFLEITPLPDSPYAQEWREKVREYHANKAKAKQVVTDACERGQNCGECLMTHVDVVLLNADGKCSCCATGHKLAGALK